MVTHVNLLVLEKRMDSDSVSRLAVFLITGLCAITSSRAFVLPTIPAVVIGPGGGDDPTEAPISTDCPPILPSPAYGKVETTYHTGNVAVYLYTCNSGYLLYGYRSVVCFNGQFSNNPPICKRSVCVETHDIGKCSVCLEKDVVCSSNPCEASNYCKLVNNSVRCCNQTVHEVDHFSLGLLENRCIETCDLPPPTSNSVYNGNATETSTSPTTATALGRRKDPTTATPSPARICPTVSPPRNGYVKVTGDTVGYRCREGYRLVGENTRKCVGGVAQGSSPRCKRVKPTKKNCFISFGGCTVCLRKKYACKADNYNTPTCPTGSYCKRIGLRKRPTCCDLSVDSFGRCSESCAFD